MKLTSFADAIFGAGSVKYDLLAKANHTRYANYILKHIFHYVTPNYILFRQKIPSQRQKKNPPQKRRKNIHLFTVGKLKKNAKPKLRHSCD